MTAGFHPSATTRCQLSTGSVRKPRNRACGWAPDVRAEIRIHASGSTRVLKALRRCGGLAWRRCSRELGWPERVLAMVPYVIEDLVQRVIVGGHF